MKFSEQGSKDLIVLESSPLECIGYDWSYSIRGEPSIDANAPVNSFELFLLAVSCLRVFLLSCETQSLAFQFRAEEEADEVSI
jgi:hypothetical protein